MQPLRTLASWAATALFAWLAYTFGRDAHSPLGAAAALAAALVLSPPLRNRIRPTAAPWCAAGVLFVVALSGASKDAASHADRERASAERLAALSAQQARDRRQADFEQRKVEILRGIAAKADAGQHRAALDEASSYPTNDPDLSNLRRTIEAAMLKREAEGDMPLQRRAFVFARLAELEPTNAGFREAARQAGEEAAAVRRAVDQINGGHCPAPGYDYERTLDAVLRAHGADQSLAQRIDNEGPFIGLVSADAKVSHRADRILSQGWKPTLRWSAVDKCSCQPAS